jgi:hypothetical protein
MNRCRWLLGFGLELAPAISVPVGFGSRKGRALSVQEMGPTWIFPNTNGLFPRVTEWCFCPPPLVPLKYGIDWTTFCYGTGGGKIVRVKIMEKYPDITHTGPGQLV